MVGSSESLVVIAATSYFVIVVIAAIHVPTVVVVGPMSVQNVVALAAGKSAQVGRSNKRLAENFKKSQRS